jgi:hypothetical protein
MELRWARSATRHRIAKSRSRYVIETAKTIIRQPAPARSPLKDERVVFLGADRSGVLLEVMGIETDAGLLVIHAMKMRRRYEPQIGKERTNGDEDE